MNAEIIKGIGLGYFVSLGIGSIALWVSMGWLFKYGETEECRDPKLKKLALFVGIVERAIYTFAVIVRAYEIIAVWLALKATAEFRTEATRERADFYIYTIGSGMSLIFGCLGGLVYIYFIK